MPADVSLILPTMGDRPSLAAALRSALAQDFPALEILVVDDSAPGSHWAQAPAIAPLLADGRVRVIPFHEQRGCAAAKNAGWAAAQGRWLCYLDDDNIYRPGKVRAQHALAVASGAPVVLCGIEFRAGARRRVKQVETTSFGGDELLLRALPDTNALFHRRDVALRWDEALRTADDACLFHGLMHETDCARVPNVPEALVIYHSHQGERVNRTVLARDRGQRRLLVRWTARYSRGARRVQLCRQLVATDKFRSDGWGRLARHAAALLRVGGWAEWRTVANAVGVKLPLVRRWMIT